MNIDDKLRNLAKTDYWQLIYRSSLESSNVQLFENVTNLSGIQIRFIYWNSVYKLLNDELANREDTRLTQAVIDNDYRADAYLIYRNKKNDFLLKKYKREEQETQLKTGRKRQFKNPGKVSTINVDLRREDK